MKRLPIVIATVAIAGLTGVVAIGATPVARAGDSAAQAAVAERTVTFAVENMYCALCPVTVKTAMSRVEGVKSVKVDYESKSALVIFDPSVATPQQIAAASTNVGYPARPAP